MLGGSINPGKSNSGAIAQYEEKKSIREITATVITPVRASSI
jgi:hypothetical protein